VDNDVVVVVVGVGAIGLVVDNVVCCTDVDGGVGDGDGGGVVLVVVGFGVGFGV